MTRYYNTSLRNLQYRLRCFKDDLNKHLEDIILSKEEEIINIVTQEQLFKEGINGKGIKIMNYQPYRPSTIKAKIRKGQPTNRVTLRDTGKFYKSMFLVFEPDGFYITSSDDKAKYLIKKYGEEIFRITDSNLTKLLREHIRKELVNRIKKEL